MTIDQILNAALLSGIAYNNVAGSQYLMCATEEQLIRFAEFMVDMAPVDGDKT